MDCDKYLELMSAALDGELSAEERRELDSHLAVCPDCAQLYQNLSGQTAVMRELDCEVPADLKERIMSNLPKQEQPAKQGKVSHWKRWAPVAAAACLALVVALVPKGGIRANKASAPDAYAPAADAPRSPEVPDAPGAAPRPSAEMNQYSVADSDSTASVSEAPGYGHLEMGGLTDPAEPSGQEPQPDGGMVIETTPAEPPMSVEPADDPSALKPVNPQVPTDPGDEWVSEDSCGFENPLVIRVSYSATPEPGALVIGSVESLEAYLDQFGSNAFNSQGSSIPNEKLEALKEAYDEEFFRTRRLLCVVVESGSGSNRYEIADVFRDGVRVSMYVPEIGTADMAAWLLTAEVDDTFHDGDTPEVSISRPSQQSTLPIGTITQDLIISLAFENQRSIRLNSQSAPEEGAVVIGSVESLNEYLNQFKSYLGEDLSEDLQQLQNHYGYDQFFVGEHLLCVLVETGRYTTPQLSSINPDRVIVEQTQDDPTFANAHFLIVAEVSANFFKDGDTLKVSIDKAYDRYCSIQNVWFQRVGISGRTSSSATVIQSMDQLTEYLENNVYYTDRVTGELVRNPEVEELISIYGAPIPEWFFESRTLLAFMVGCPVYNPTYEVLTVSSKAVTVRQDHYLYGNACPSTWLVLVEAHGDLDPDNPPKLVVVDGYP